jgi:hypothetical protein
MAQNEDPGSLAGGHRVEELVAGQQQGPHTIAAFYRQTREEDRRRAFWKAVDLSELQDVDFPRMMG